MLTVRGASQRLCDRISRRDVLRLGALGGIELTLPALLRAADQPQAHAGSFGRAERCVLLFLTGGPPQHDTWDPKPDAPAEIRGELTPIATAVPGLHVSELFPRLARSAGKYCVLRSVSHHDTVHTSAGYTMLTGAPHLLANSGSATKIRPTPNDHPHIGSLLAKVRRPDDGMPVFASLPEVIKDAAVNEFPGQGAGFLGGAYEPFRIQGTATSGGLQLPDIFLPADVPAGRLNDRRLLLDEFDRALATADQRPVIAELDEYYRQAFRLISSSAARNAFQLDREPARVHAAYGTHLFGQGCVLARRLCEAGVRLVTVYWHYEGPDDSPVWDTHQNNYPHLRNRLAPPTDQAIAALLSDLDERGLLDSTLVVCMGEFGRSPKINKQGGRDHWPAVQSIILAGGGIRSGCVLGASDKTGAYPSLEPVTPADLAATILHLLGVPSDLEVHDRTGRQLRACTGSLIHGLLA